MNAPERLRRATANIRKAEQRRDELIRSLWPVGRIVQWDLASGPVLEHGENGWIRIREAGTRESHWMDCQRIIT